ncbi:MAG TPA: L-histidine N(alpha)-methyltransferase [Steroidobacteraceae bacterium]|nr:L-histidine N(alpha)-methyltransferase [Steroidobacteraceae bacterium]
MTPRTTARRPRALEDLTPAARHLLDELITGLKQTPKQIPPKYFYDDRGSKLFDRICELPEYYPTRTELAIMSEQVGEMAEAIGPEAAIFEFGSGTSEKTRRLLRALDRPVAYLPVEIARSHLLAAANRLAAEFPGVEIIPVCADFTQPFELPQPSRSPRRWVAYFPGSTIGNFENDEAQRLLELMGQETGPGGGALIGVDLRKDASILLPAYDDAQGVTSEFNKNLLVRLNREFDADFDLDAFRHVAIWNPDDGRMEMYLESLADQEATLGNETLHFERGERILTEYSHKYRPEDFAELAAAAGWRVARVWTDAERLFSVQYLERR